MKTNFRTNGYSKNRLVFYCAGELTQNITTLLSNSLLHITTSSDGSSRCINLLNRDFFSSLIKQFVFDNKKNRFHPKANLLDKRIHSRGPVMGFRDKG